jgi:hypothetical protein
MVVPHHMVILSKPEKVKSPTNQLKVLLFEFLLAFRTV